MGGGGSGGYYLELESTLHSFRNAPFSQISWVGSKKPMKPRLLLHWKLALIYRHSLPHLSQALYDFVMMALRFSNDGFSYFGPRYLFLE